MDSGRSHKNAARMSSKGPIRANPQWHFDVDEVSGSSCRVAASGVSKVKNMEAKRVATIGLLTAAAGAGAYFMFSQRFAPTRQKLATKVRTGTKYAIDEASRIAGDTRRNVKTALSDVSEITEKAATNL
jgi:hypothetical protein